MTSSTDSAEASAHHRLRPPRFVRGAALAIALAVVAVPNAAAASTTVDGNWWFERFGVADVQAEGWDGSGVRVAVIDGQLNPGLPVFADASLTVAEPSICGGPAATTEATDDAVHGTEVLAFLVGNGEGNGSVRGIAPGADVTFYGYGDRDGEAALCRLQEERSAWAVAIDQAVADGAQIISTSTVFGTLSNADAESVAAALAKGVVIVSAMPNTNVGSDATIDKPAALNGVVSVAGFGPDGAIVTSEATGQPNIHPEVTVVAPGEQLASANWVEEQIIRGTSFATPMVAGILAVTWQKYPEATANQLIQSLIRNTTAEDHPLDRDTTAGYGYGPASLRHMLAVDPTQYPDENPLMDKASGVPTAQQVADAAAGPVATPTPSDDPASPPAATGDGAGWVLGGGIALVVLIAGAAVLTIVLTRRHARRSNGGVS